MLTEHRFDREKVYAAGVPCGGMLDINKIKESADSVLGITDKGDTVEAETLYDGTVTLNRADLLPDRCANCKSKKHVAYDELLGTDGEVADSARFDEVEKLEKMTADERYRILGRTSFRAAFAVMRAVTYVRLVRAKSVCWIRGSPFENKAASNSFGKDVPYNPCISRCRTLYRLRQMLRVCAQHIPLHLLNRKFIKDIDELYGEYQAGAEVGSRAPHS